MLDGNALTLHRPFRTLDLAPWHAERPHLVVNSLLQIREQTPDLAGLAEWIVPRLPRRTLASDTLHSPRASSRSAVLSYALGGRWVAFNTAEYVNAITIDVDHTGWSDAVNLAVDFYGCPRPLAVTGPSGTAHLTWFLDTPVCVGPKARPKPIALLAHVRAGLTAMFRADRGYTNRLTKNPFDPAWTALFGDGRRLELRDLKAAVEAWRDDEGLEEPKPIARPRPIPATSAFAGNERGKRLFDAVRHRCYATGQCNGDVILEWAEQIAADLRSPAPPKVITAIARSVARFMNTRWNGRRRGIDDCNRGVMRLGSTRLSTAEKQGMAGKRTATIVVRRTDAAIEAAVQELQSAGRPFTQSDVATCSEVSLRTVKRRWSDIAARVPSAVASGSALIEGVREAMPTSFENDLNLESYPSAKPRRFGSTVPAPTVVMPRCLQTVRTVSKSRFLSKALPIQELVEEQPSVRKVGRDSTPPTAAEIRVTVDLMTSIIDQLGEPIEVPPVHARLLRIPEVRRVVREAERASREAWRRWRARPQTDAIFEDDDPG